MCKKLVVVTALLLLGVSCIQGFSEIGDSFHGELVSIKTIGYYGNYDYAITTDNRRFRIYNDGWHIFDVAFIMGLKVNVTQLNDGSMIGHYSITNEKNEN